MHYLKAKLTANKNIIIAICISLVFALIIFLPNLFSLAAPSSGDVRAHVFKIGFLYQHLSHGSIPVWNPYWYDGIPFDPAYPPLFYYLGAMLTFITTQAVISFKLIMLLTMASNGFAAYYFSRKCLKLNFIYSLVCLIAFETSTALLLNYGYGAIPDLLGWTICVFFLGFYLNNIIYNKIFQAKDILIPGLLFGLTLLTHPFPAIFGLLAVFLFHLVYWANGNYRTISFKNHLKFFILVFAIAALISSYYWIPFLINRNFVSPIYTTLSGTWPGGTLFIGMLSIFSLLIAMFAWRKTNKDLMLQVLLVCVILALALGFGAAQFMPFGLGSLLHGFRYATVMLPFFCVLLAIYSLQLLASKIEIKRFYVYSIVILLLLLTSVIPLSNSYNKTVFSDLFSYVQDYTQPAYIQILNAVKNGRLVVPITRGYLCEGDSPVTFGWNYGVQTVNGPFNQGDPKFFDQTVYMEWEEAWFNYTFTRENLMQESDAQYLFIRSAQGSFKNMQTLNLVLRNSYGLLWSLKEPVFNAVNVTPILLDVSNPTQVNEYFNVLMPTGYKMIFVNTNDINNQLKQKIEYVMVDSESKAAKYPGKMIFVLNNSDQNNVLINNQNSNIIEINTPYQTYSNEFFYQGDKADVSAQSSFYGNNGGLNPNVINSLTQIGNKMSDYLQQLQYQPVNITSTENNIEVSGQPGFTLIKDSYYPYWHTTNGDLVPTLQGFMLVYSTNNQIQLICKMPTINIITGIITLLSLFTGVAFLIILAIKQKAHSRQNHFKT